MAVREFVLSGSSEEPILMTCEPEDFCIPSTLMGINSRAGYWSNCYLVSIDQYWYRRRLFLSVHLYKVQTFGCTMYILGNTTLS